MWGAKSIPTNPLGFEALTWQERGKVVSVWGTGGCGWRCWWRGRRGSNVKHHRQRRRQAATTVQRKLGARRR